MSPSSRPWPLLAVLLASAAAYISQTPEPPGAVLYDRHWPYMAPGGGGGGSWWWWRPQRQREWWRSKRLLAEQTETAATESGSAMDRKQDHRQSEGQSPSPGRDQNQDRNQVGDQADEGNRYRDQNQDRDQVGDQADEGNRYRDQNQDGKQSQQHQQNQHQDHAQKQDRGRDRKRHHHWPEFLQESSAEGTFSKVLSRQRRKHGRPQRWTMERLCEERGECTCLSQKTRATFCCDCEWGSCFPGRAVVTLADGRSRTMDQLRVGDDVMTVTPAGDLVPTAVLGFLDRRPTARGEYLQLQLAAGHRLRLSSSHVAFTRRRPGGLFAGEVRAGDLMMTAAGNRTAYSAVVRVDHVVMTGAFVPLTEHGTLLVDGVLASNYASFPHGLSHALTAPFRLWPALLSEWFVVAEKNVLVAGLKKLGRLVVAAPPAGVLRVTSL